MGHWEASHLTIIHTVAATTGRCINDVAGRLERIDDVVIHGGVYGIVLGNSVGTRVQHSEISGFSNSGILIDGGCNDIFLRDIIISGAKRDGTVGAANTGLRIINKAEALMIQGLEIILCNSPLFMTGAGVGTGNTLSFSRFFQVSSTVARLRRALITLSTFASPIAGSAIDLEAAAT